MRADSSRQPPEGMLRCSAFTWVPEEPRNGLCLLFRPGSCFALELSFTPQSCCPRRFWRDPLRPEMGCKEQKPLEAAGGWGHGNAGGAVIVTLKDTVTLRDTVMLGNVVIKGNGPPTLLCPHHVPGITAPPLPVSLLFPLGSSVRAKKDAPVTSRTEIRWEEKHALALPSEGEEQLAQGSPREV